jgi:hypothetical protein
MHYSAPSCTKTYDRQYNITLPLQYGYSDDLSLRCLRIQLSRSVLKNPRHRSWQSGELALPYALYPMTNGIARTANGRLDKC